MGRLSGAAMEFNHQGTVFVGWRDAKSENAVTVVTGRLPADAATV
ncbi:MAG: hypothetical protein AAB214_20030 [Fibrobacterota bacterium]